MKEPKIAQMDWRSLGYWPVWKDGKKVWVPKDKVTDSESQDSQSCFSTLYFAPNFKPSICYNEIMNCEYCEREALYNQPRKEDGQIISVCKKHFTAVQPS